VYSKLGSAYLAAPVITEADEAERVLQSLCELMEERYNLVSSAGKRNIKEYNALTIVEPMPYIVVVIDEYGDLIMQSGKTMERSICRLAQKARAVGIHLIISTQRPSATIVTGNIKANFPTRIAFRTTTGTDSRVILDQTGAEKLTGCGDMIYFAGAETTRVQCAYASIEEVSKSCEEIGEANDDYKDRFSMKTTAKLSHPLFECIEERALVIAKNYTLINERTQRNLFYYFHADWQLAFQQLEELGIVSQPYGYENTRKVLIHDEQQIRAIISQYG
jgi:S-DNA-T family DNA segregation ATPase FtsK/SpoIIIE